ncbi:hypothetical protein CDIK_2671 [Cucumispora dikerogammari]|nr:hypothetical protein CDIK_2671 [Cucumispora dikerogammari]
MFAILINSSNLICTESECRKRKLETNSPTTSVKLEMHPYYDDEKDITVEYDEDAHILKATFILSFFETFEGKISSFEFTLKKYEKLEKPIKNLSNSVSWKKTEDKKISTNQHSKYEMGYFCGTNIEKFKFTLDDDGYSQIVASVSLPLEKLNKKWRNWSETRLYILREALYIFPEENIQKIAFKIEAKFTIKAKEYKTTNVFYSTKLFGFNEHTGSSQKLSLISNITT